MSAPESSAEIKFPVRMIDSEIRKELEEYGVIFKEDDPREQGNPMEVYGGGELSDLEAEIEDGIFRLRDSSARYGEFEGLETRLKEKGIPFDRQSWMDWDRPPCLVIYRPGTNGQPTVNLYIPLDPETDEPVVSVKTIQELLAIDDAGEEAASAIQRYLDEHFPDYPPLTDWVKDA